eukprot:scaffold7624_cov248-Pinguiococcus_pyrenoidosus.AAC.10
MLSPDGYQPSPGCARMHGSLRTEGGGKRARGHQLPDFKLWPLKDWVLSALSAGARMALSI